MSVEFGLWNFRQSTLDPMRIGRVRKMLSAYACDGESEYSDDEVALLHLPFHVTPESESERQPFLTSFRKDLALGRSPRQSSGTHRIASRDAPS